jgi:hypothetical protein
MDLHKAYLINLQIQREQREHFHWQRLVKEAKRETHSASPQIESSEQLGTTTREKSLLDSSF